MPKGLPQTLTEFKALIANEYSSLSKRLQQVAKYVMEHPNEIAFGTVATIATDAGVHPSTLVRFANAFNYSGFSEMQRLFQQQLLHESPSYSDRMRIARESFGEDGRSSENLLVQFSNANSAALEQLVVETDIDALCKAVELLSSADTIHIMGVRRAFVVASYFAYAIRHADRRAFLIDGIGGLTKEQSGSIRKGDALIAISFNPYANETQEVVRDAIDRDIPVVLITDSALSPLASLATVTLTVKEAEVHGIRSLSSSLCLAQTIAIGLTQD